MDASVTFSYNSDHGCVVVTYGADFRMHQAPSYYAKLKAFMEHHVCDRCLLDARGRDHVPPSDPEIMLKAHEAYVQLGLPRSWRRAMLVDSIGAGHQFWEDSMTNRGHVVRLFTDPQAAFEWLASDRPVGR